MTRTEALLREADLVGTCGASLLAVRLSRELDLVALSGAAGGFRRVADDERLWPRAPDSLFGTVNKSLLVPGAVTVSCSDMVVLLKQTSENALTALLCCTESSVHSSLGVSPLRHASQSSPGSRLPPGQTERRHLEKHAAPELPPTPPHPAPHPSLSVGQRGRSREGLAAG